MEAQRRRKRRGREEKRKKGKRDGEKESGREKGRKKLCFSWVQASKRHCSMILLLWVRRTRWREGGRVVEKSGLGFGK